MEAAPDHDSAGGAEGSTRYPDYLMPIAGNTQPSDQRFSDLREKFLLGYGYNTARAYRADLDDLYEWADSRGLDVLSLGEREMKRYVALLRRRKYSENTIRRRQTTYRQLVQVIRQNAKSKDK